MARDLKRTYGGGSGSGNNMGGSCAAASVIPSMHYLARNGEMGGLAAKGSSSDHDITAATHGLLQQLPFPSSSNNVKVERSSSPAAAVYESTGLYHPSLHSGRAGAQAQQAAAEAAAHEAQSGCGLTENSALINNGSNSSQNGGSGSETVDKGGGGGVNPQRSAEDWWDSWAAPPAPTSAAAAATVAEFGTFKAAGGGGYGNFDELDSIMLMLPAPAPDQTLMRYLMGESQQSHQQGLQAALQQGGGGVLRMKDMDAVMIEQDSWSSNHEQQQQSAQSEISHPHGSGGGDASFSGISPSSAPSCVVGVIPTSAEPTSAFLTPSFPPSLPRALSLPSHMRNITLNSGGEQHHHHHHRPNSEVSVAGVSIDMRSMNGPSGGYPFPAAPTSSSSMAAAAASYSDSPDSSSSVPGDFFRQTLLSNSNGFQALQTAQENNSFVALQASMGMKEVPPPPHPIHGGQTSPSSNQAFRLNHHQHHPPPSLGQGSSCFYQDSRDITTTTTPPHRNLQRSFTSLPSLSSMDQQMKQLQGMGVNRDYLLQRQKSWQPGRRSPSRHFISDHQHHHHHHHQPHAPHQNTPGDWKLDMSRMQTVRSTSLSPAPPVQGGFTFSSPKLESSFKGEEKKEGLVNPPDTGQQQQQEGGVIPEGGLNMVTYLLRAAEAAEVGNTEVAKAILARLNQHISPARGKPFHRVAYYFQQALLTHMMGAENFTEKLLPDRSLPPLEEYHKINAYVHFCEVSPVPKFAHFTANQAIMEAMEGENSVHVIDFRLGAGAQWASFLQDIASMQAAGKLTPRVRLTAVGPNSDEMNATGANLSAFAQSLNISLEFQAVVTSCQQLLELSMLNLRDQEAIAVNFVFSLHRLLDDTFSNGLNAVLKTVRDAKPKVITVVEQEANHNGSNFQERFSEAFQYYLFLFDSLTSSLEPGSDSSLVNASIESYLLAPEILNIVAAEGASRVERHERLEQWRIRMCTAGFQSRPLSDASHFQADKLLSERSPRRGGFQVARDNGCLLLGWQGRPLLAASSWTC